MRLGPLAREQVFELLRSVFGPARYLERLSERLYGVCGGNPTYCLEVAQYLALNGNATYREGVWILPTELPPERLPQSLHVVHLKALAHLFSLSRRAGCR